MQLYIWVHVCDWAVNMPRLVTHNFSSQVSGKYVAQEHGHSNQHIYLQALLTKYEEALEFILLLVLVILDQQHSARGDK